MASSDALFPPLSSARGERKTLAYIAYASICIIWGTTFVAIRVAIETIPTLFVSGFRFVIAGTLLLLVALALRARFPRSVREWRAHAISGILMAGIANTLVVYAERVITGGLAALLAATIPIWMSVLEGMTAHRPLTRFQLFGLALGFGGVALLVAPAIGHVELSIPFFIAVAAMQGNALSFVAGSLYSRHHATNSDPMANSVIQLLSGGICILLFAFLIGQRPHPSMYSMRSVVALLYMAIFGSFVAYTAYNYALSKLSASKVASYAYVNPAVAVIVGAILLAEPVTLRMIVAMFVILSGVAVIQREKFVRSR